MVLCWPLQPCVWGAQDGLAGLLRRRRQAAAHYDPRPQHSPGPQLAGPSSTPLLWPATGAPVCMHTIFPTTHITAQQLHNSYTAVTHALSQLSIFSTLSLHSAGPQMDVPPPAPGCYPCNCISIIVNKIPSNHSVLSGNTFAICSTLFQC